MKKFTITLFFATFATATFSQDWTPITSGLYLNPVSANLGVGEHPMLSTKLRIWQDGGNITTGHLWGISSTFAAYYTNSATMYGADFSASKENNSSTGIVYGLKAYAYHGGASGTAYGLYSNVAARDNNTIDKYSGYFTGGKFAVMNGSVGIGTTTPKTLFDVGASLGLSVAATNIDPSSNYSLSFLSNTGRLLLAWNRSGYKGEQNFIANRGAGSVGGFAFYDFNNNNQLRHLMTINGDGNVGIGIENPTASLDVIGTIKAREIDVLGIIRAEEVKVCLAQGCDFVFEEDYPLMSLKDLSAFITKNKHLPEIAPAAIMESEGINLSEMNAKLLQKIEELTLYVIDLQKQIDELKK